MKKFCLLILTLLLANNGFCQKILSLEDCRQKALENNKGLQIAKENVEIANQLKKAAFAQFLPDFAATASYSWNEKNVSMLAEDAHLPVGTIKADGSFGFRPDQVTNGHPNDFALLPKEALEFNLKNVFTGYIGFTQPIYMGGKIRELNKLAQYGQNLANINTEKVTTDLLLEVDEAYWRVVSVEAKVELATEYRELIIKADTDMKYLLEQGLATRADELKVKVKLNEADLAMTRAQDGLNLSRMALNQLCGLHLEEHYKLADTDALKNMQTVETIPVKQALELRPEVRALKEMQNIANSNTKIAYSRFLPTVVLVGGYMVSNPNIYNGFENKFGGMMNVGVVGRIPIFHFGERTHVVRAAKAQARVVGWEIEEIEEKIELQLTQSAYRVAESVKKQGATLRNIENAEENLRLTNEGFKEGVISSTDLLGAQTAWLAAKSDNIDANIDVRLCRLYLEKAQGRIVEK